MLENGNQGSNGSESQANDSAFADFGKKVKRLAPFLWPKRSVQLQFRVVLCFFFLVFGRVINVFVPQYNKYISK